MTSGKRSGGKARPLSRSKRDSTRASPRASTRRASASPRDASDVVHAHGSPAPPHHAPGPEPQGPELVENEAKDGFPIVGVGASAGGLDSFTQLLTHLPPDTGMGFVLVQHLDPTHASMMTEILSRVTPMPVIEVREGMRVEPDHVYMIPPNAALEISEGVLHLSPRGGGHAPHLTVDTFFRSLARDQGHRAVGVVLSGTGTDGTLGLEAIKGEGGITFAQDEDSATHAGMPHHAVATGCVDIVASPPEIAQELTNQGRGIHQARIRRVVSGDRDPLAPIFQALRKATNVDFALYKRPMVIRRIERRMALQKAGTLEDYTRAIQERPAEVKALFQDLLIHVTRFFRDPAAFQGLADTVFPALLEEPRNEANPIRIWVPGCSTGEECYSVGITLLEFLGEREPPIQIFCTDVSPAMVARARLGLYPENIELDVSVPRLRRFFVKTDRGYQVGKRLREMCVFSPHDLAKDPPFSRLDLVTCRNVLIYMTTELQRRIMPAFHFGLKPKRFLMLGGAETIHGFTDLFGVVDQESHIYARKETRGRVPVYIARREAAGPTPAPRLAEAGPTPARDIQREADRVVLNKFGPSGVVVNEALDIVQFRGDTTPFLSPTSGQASLSLFSMVRPGLLMALRDAVRRARRRNTQVRAEGLHLDLGDRALRVNVDVLPIASATGERHLVIVFEAVTEQRTRPGPGSKEGSAARRTDTQRQVAQLQEELLSTKEYLRSIIGEQESVNQELMAANEEVISTNEELQSTNEELETAKEELQSTNEELTTLNEQVVNRNAELNLANDDLTNLLTSMNMPIVMLSSDLRLRRITPLAAKLLNVTTADLGRPIDYVMLRLDVPNLQAILQEVIDSARPVDMEVQDRDGRWQSLRIRPYRTGENRIEGAVLAVIDIHELRTTALALRTTEEIVASVREPFVVLDLDLRVRAASRNFYRLFQLAQPETEGRSIFELSNGRWNVPSLRALLEVLIPKGARISDFDVDELSELAGGRALSVTAERIVPGPANADPLIFLSFADVTERRIAAQRIASSEREVLERERVAREDAESDSRAKDVFMATLSHELRTPLAAMLGWVGLLRSGDLDVATTTRGLEAIERSTRAQAQLIEDLLDVSRIMSGKLRLDLRPMDLPAAIEAAVETMRPTAKAKGVRLDLSIEPIENAVVGDRDRLQQAVWNLVSNAIKFTPQGRGIQVALEWVDSSARITVRDTGRGISADFMPRIFEPFRQSDSSTRRVQTGLGLGLAIVKHIVELHGGAIRAESEGEGRGSTFVVDLPLSRASGSVRETLGVTITGEAPSESAGELRDMRVLIVDDFADTRDVVTAVLHRYGAEVTAVGSAEEALNELAGSTFDVLVCDIAMPGLDGYDLIDRIRALPPEQGGRIPAVAFTAYARGDDASRVLAAGFQAHLPKPADPVVLAMTVLRLRESPPNSTQSAVEAGSPRSAT
jgi:two-component system, chemotaxis family, CheB/CheR fusion protein